MGEKIIGILGGMGPEATADLFYRIIRATPVKRDQDHVRTIIYSDSKVPDRTPAILGEGEDPVRLCIADVHSTILSDVYTSGMRERAEIEPELAKREDVVAHTVKD